MVVEDEERHVIFLGLASRPTGDLLEKFMSDGWGWEIQMRFQKLLAARETEFLGRNIFGFGKAIGVQEIAVAGLERDFEGCVFRAGKHAQEKTVLLDGASPTVRTIDEQHRWMASSGIAEKFAVEIDENVSGSDEMRFEFSAEGLIE